MDRAAGDATLDVRRVAQLLGERSGQGGDLGRLHLGQHRHRPQQPWHRHLPGTLGGRRTRHRHHLLGADVVREHRPIAIDDDVIGGGHARDDRLAEPPVGGDDGVIAIAADRIDGEHDEGDIGANETLDDDGDLRRLFSERGAATIAHRAVRPERGPAGAHGGRQRGGCADIEHGVMQAGEGVRAGILGGRRRSDSERDIGGVRGGETVPRFADGRFDSGGQRRLQQLRANPGQVERGGIGDALGQAERSGDLAIGVGGERDGLRNGRADGEETTETRPLAADEGSVVLGTVEPDEQTIEPR